MKLISKNRPAPHEEAVALGAASAVAVTVKGPRNPNLKGVLYMGLSYDEGMVAGTVQQDVLVRIRPEHHTDYAGGDIYHSFYGQPVLKGAPRNVIWLGFMLPPGEDIELQFLSALGVNIRFNLQRYLIFDTERLPELIAPGGLSVQ